MYMGRRQGQDARRIVDAAHRRRPQSAKSPHVSTRIHRRRVRPSSATSTAMRARRLQSNFGRNGGRAETQVRAYVEMTGNAEPISAMLGEPRQSPQAKKRQPSSDLMALLKRAGLPEYLVHTEAAAADAVSGIESKVVQDGLEREQPTE